MKFSLRKSLTAIALAAMIFGSSSLYSQNLVNQSTGSIHIYAGGQVVLHDDAGEFQNGQANIANIVNEGKIVFKGTTNVFTDLTSDPDGATALGSTDALRVPGDVEYSGAANTQDVQASRYFTNLIIDNTGGTITFPAASNTWLSGTYTKTNGTTDFSDNTFYFDGDTGEDQTLDFTESFNNLVFSQAGVKTIDPAGVVTVGGTFDIAATATDITTINGVLNLGAGIGTIDAAAGEVVLNNAAARLNLGAGKVTFNNTAGLTLTAGEVNVDNGGTGAELEIADGVVFNVSAVGGILNVTGDNTLRLIGDLTTDVLVGDRANFNFACSSFEIYESANAQEVMAVDDSHPYGNLQVLNSTKSLENSIYLCSDLTVTDATLDAYGAGDNYKITLQGGTLGDTPNNITFGSDADEIRGLISRAHDFATATPYTYNNNNTIITFSTINASSLTNFDVSSVSGVDPMNYDAVTGIHRQILLDYNGAADIVWTTSIGFRESEKPVTNTYPVSSVRFYEGDPGIISVEKMSTGFAYTRTTGAAPDFLHLVSLPGFHSTSDGIDNIADNLFLANDELDITFGPSVFISIADGRWSNPGTWDEGAQPGPDDEVIIRSTVHVGYQRDIDANYGPTTAKSGTTGGNAEGQWLTDNFSYNPADATMQIASKVTIDDPTTPASQHYALLFGNGSEGAVNYLIGESAAVSGSATLTNNNNSGTNLLDLTGLVNNGDVLSATYDGFYILNSNTALDMKTFDNAGNAGVAGPLNIGN